MALGGATKKLQKVIDTAEETYKRLDELREQVHLMRETLTDTHRRVRGLERELEDQRAVIEALARQEGVDVDSVLAEAAIEEAEPVTEAAEEAAGSDASGAAAVGEAESGDGSSDA
jgi:uncharacterized coiled-coil DUF342 family protein